MELILEILIQIAGEFLVQLLFEGGFRGIAGLFRAVGSGKNRLLTLTGYAVFGTVAGGLSLLLIPKHLIGLPLAQYVNLIVSPILLGFVFEWLGRRRETKGKEKLIVDRFSYGFVFALTMGLIRFLFAH